MKFQNSKSLITAFLAGFLGLSAYFGAALGASNSQEVSFGKGLRPHLSDSGSPDDIQRIKAEVQNLLALEQEWGNLTKTEMNQIVDHPDSGFTARWEKQAYSIWTELEAESNIKAVEQMLAEEGDYRLDNSWKKLSVEVLEWQGVVLEGDTATAQFVQQNRMQRARGERVTPPVQWRAIFKRSADTGQLLISSKVGVDFESGR